MLEEFLNQNRELFVIAPSKLLRLLNDGYHITNIDVACIFYREEEDIKWFNYKDYDYD